MSYKTYILDIIKKYNNTLNNLVVIFSILNVIATTLIGLITLFAPNIHVHLFQKEPTSMILITIVLTMILLSMRPLIKRTGFILIRFFLGFIITIFICYSTYLFFTWYFIHVEGTFSYRFLTFTKKASLEVKLDLYQTLVFQFIETIKINDQNMAIYLEKSPSIMNPSTATIMHTSYDNIPMLAEQKILLEKQHYIKMLENVSIPQNKPSSNNYNIIRKILIGCGITIGVAASGYLIISYFSMGAVIKKVLFKLIGTQHLLGKVAESGKATAKEMVELNEDISSLTGVVNALRIQANNNDVQAEKLLHFINHVIRPVNQAIFAGLKSLTPEKAKLILNSLTQEQKDFIEVTSKLIFN